MSSWQYNVVTYGWDQDKGNPWEAFTAEPCTIQVEAITALDARRLVLKQCYKQKKRVAMIEFISRKSIGGIS